MRHTGAVEVVPLLAGWTPPRLHTRNQRDLGLISAAQVCPVYDTRQGALCREDARRRGRSPHVEEMGLNAMLVAEIEASREGKAGSFLVAACSEVKEEPIKSREVYGNYFSKHSDNV